MDLAIDIKNDDKKYIVTLAGEIDIYTAPKLKENLLPLTKHDNHTIEVDCKDVHYMDSTGLGIFIGVLKSAKKYNSHLKLVNLADRLLRLFRITGLNKIIDVNGQVQGGTNNDSI